jgi:hypothetical protein
VARSGSGNKEFVVVAVFLTSFCHDFPALTCLCCVRKERGLGETDRLDGVA